MDKVFVNIIADDVESARKFYTGLGYKIVEDYSSELGVCIKVSEGFYIMAITKDHLKTFIDSRREIGNPSKQILSTIAFSLATKDEVYEVAKKAKKFGGTVFAEPAEEFGMLATRICDPSGNILEYGCF